MPNALEGATQEGGLWPKELCIGGRTSASFVQSPVFFRQTSMPDRFAAPPVVVM